MGLYLCVFQHEVNVGKRFMLKSYYCSPISYISSKSCYITIRITIMTQPRTRSRTKAGIPVYRDWAYTLPGKDEVSGSDLIGTAFASSESITDYVTPNYREVIKGGGIINNPFSYSNSEHESAANQLTLTTWNSTDPSKKTIYQKSGYCTLYELRKYNGPVFNHTGLTTDATDLYAVKLKALAKIDSTDYAFGEDALEIRETVKLLKTGFNLLKNPLKEVSAIAKKIKRASDKNRRILNMNHTDALNSAYLQYRFALTPTVRSVMDIIDATGKDVTPRKVRYFARAKEVSSQSSYAEANTSGQFVLGQNIDQERTTRATIMYDIKVDVDRGFRFQLGLRNKDIIPTLWAVAPLSFMVDRMFDITSALKGLSNLADPDIRLLACSTSTKTVKTTKTKFVGVVPNGAPPATQWEGSYGPGEDVVTTVAYNRSVWYPNPFDTLPEINFGGLVEDFTRSADLASIAWSMLSGKSK